MERKYNTKSPAVKRLMREAAELSTPTSEYYAAPLEENLFEWHFTVRGPEGSEFQEGVYHGRIIVPTEYPMKPPDIILLTPNGRFAVGQKICLSISGHHPETWQPSWSIRTALLAIIGFMPTPGKGTIGSLDYTPQERKILAQRSVNYYCDTCGLRPATLLLPPNQSERSDNKEEVREILESVQLKPETEKEKKEEADKEAIEDKNGGRETESVDQKENARENEAATPASPSQPSSQMTQAAASSADASTARSSPHDSCPLAAARTADSGTSTTERQAATHMAAEEIVPANSFQVYDIMIGIIVVLIGLIVFRRLASQGSDDMSVEDTAEDLAEISE